MTNRSTGTLGAAVLGTALLVAGLGTQPSRVHAAAAAPSANDACTAQSTWVTQPSQPNFNSPPPNHCGFYQYAWQSFLYLTSPSAGPGSPLVFETFPSADDVFSTSANATAATGRMRRFTAVDPRTKKTRTFRQRVSKPAPLSTTTGALDFDDHQAGSGGVLVDQANNIAYYEEFLDPGFAVPFIKACTLTVKSCASQPGAAGLQFPVGSLELKVAWRPLWKKTSENVSSYYLIPGVPVEDAYGKTVTPDYFGLVGLHLVYALADHPELVWGTFEHVDNAPDAPCVSGQQTCSQLPAGFTKWSFNDCKSKSCGNVNTWPTPTPPPSPIPQAQAFREYASGTMPSLVDAAGVAGSDNVKIIANLNQSVRGLLPKGSVWSNYFFSGAVWTTNGQKGVVPALAAFLANGQKNPGFNLVGSTFLANSTMETFTQFPNPVPSPYNNPVQSCFTCHDTAASTQASPPPTQSPEFKISHVFGLAGPGTCTWTTAPPSACLATQTVKPKP